MAKSGEGEVKGKVVDDDNDDTLELDPHTQVLIEELNISIESAQQLLQQFGSVKEVLKQQLLEEMKVEESKPKSILKANKVEFKEEEGLSDYEDALDGMDVDGYDEHDAPDAPTSSAGAAAVPVIRLPEWRMGVQLKRWCFIARKSLKKYRARNEASKSLAVLDRLAVSDSAFETFLALNNNTTTERALETMSNDDSLDYSWKKSRQASWPKYQEGKDTVTAFNTAMKLEMDDSKAPDSEAKSAYIAGLSGMARNLASMRHKTDKKITALALMEYVEQAMEKTDTHADVNMLDSFKQADRKETIAEFAPALLEKTTAVLLPRDYTEKQIKEQALGYFVRNVKPEIGKQLKLLYPKTWEDAIPLARNIEADLPETPVMAPFSKGSKKGGGNGKKGKAPFDIAKVRCHYCKNLGHFKSDCPSLSKKAKNGSTGAAGGSDASPTNPPPNPG